MKNVFTGFQTSKMGFPKVHLTTANKEFSIHKSAPTLRKPAIRMTEPKLPKKAKWVGKNPGVFK